MRTVVEWIIMILLIILFSYTLAGYATRGEKEDLSEEAYSEYSKQWERDHAELIRQVESGK